MQGIGRPAAGVVACRILTTARRDDQPSRTGLLQERWMNRSHRCFHPAMRRPAVSRESLR